MEVLKIRTDVNSPWIEIPAIIGPPGKDYVLTQEDKEEIAEIGRNPVILKMKMVNKSKSI